MSNITYKAQLDQYGFPIGAPVTQGTTPAKSVPWQFGVRQPIQTKRIKTSNLYVQKQTGAGTILGMNVQAGSTTVFNNLGSVSHDIKGVVSVNNFSTGGTYDAGGTSVSNQGSGTWGTLPGSTTVVLTRTQNVMLSGGGAFNVSKNDIVAGFSGYILAGFKVDGSVLPTANGFGDVCNYMGALSGYFHGMSSFQYMLPLNAGTHNIYLIWQGVNGAGTATITAESDFVYYSVYGT